MGVGEGKVGGRGLGGKEGERVGSSIRAVLVGDGERKSGRHVGGLQQSSTGIISCGNSSCSSGRS